MLDFDNYNLDQKPHDADPEKGRTWLQEKHVLILAHEIQWNIAYMGCHSDHISNRRAIQIAFNCILEDLW